MKITIVAGARPNFIKIAPLISEIKYRHKLGEKITYRLVHTGQHYDDAMSGQFFKDLEIPQPDINLNCGGGSQAEQTAQIMVSFETELKHNPSDLVLVVGDVNSTMACSITAKKMHIPVAHVEAGIRSNDFTMPEEINRIVTDSLSDYLFTTSRPATKYLYSIGKTAQQVYFVGNIMIDTMLKFKSKFKKPQLFSEHNLQPKNYFVLTLHRPSNVDEENSLKDLVQHICQSAGDYPIVFPLHPRTAQKLDLSQHFSNLIITSPMGYLEFNYLIENAKGVLTDSGGITEETTVMNIPCMSLRENTERPETIDIGTNVLVGTDKEKIKWYIDKMIEDKWKEGNVPELWDGKTAERIVDILLTKRP